MNVNRILDFAQMDSLASYADEADLHDALERANVTPEEFDTVTDAWLHERDMLIDNEVLAGIDEDALVDWSRERDWEAGQ